MFENYKILLLESEFNGEISLAYIINEITVFKMIDNNRGFSGRRFNFGIANTREYFCNFSFDMYEFKRNNRIIPVHDFDLIMELNVEKLRINATHPDYIGGFIFKYIRFNISEYDNTGNEIIHRTLHEFKFGQYNLRITRRLHFKAGKQYEFSFFDDIRRRIIDNKDESYDVKIDFWLRFYYTTDKDRYFDEEYLWIDLP